MDVSAWTRVFRLPGLFSQKSEKRIFIFKSRNTGKTPVANQRTNIQTRCSQKSVFILQRYKRLVARHIYSRVTTSKFCDFSLFLFMTAIFYFFVLIFFHKILLINRSMSSTGRVRGPLSTGTHIHEVYCIVFRVVFWRLLLENGVICRVGFVWV